MGSSARWNFCGVDGGGTQAEGSHAAFRETGHCKGPAGPPSWNFSCASGPGPHLCEPSCPAPTKGAGPESCPWCWDHCQLYRVPPGTAPTLDSALPLRGPGLRPSFSCACDLPAPPLPGLEAQLHTPPRLLLDQTRGEVLRWPSYSCSGLHGGVWVSAFLVYSASVSHPLKKLLVFNGWMTDWIPKLMAFRLFWLWLIVGNIFYHKSVQT